MELRLNEDRRKHPRSERVQLVVRFDGQTYTAANWSMGGFLLDDYDGALSTGALVTVAGLGTSSEDMHAVELPARVVRTGSRSLAINYLGLDAEAYALLTASLSACGEMRSLV